MRLVEGYGSGTAPIEGRTYPMPSLVEDEDGVRLLILPALDEVGAEVWGRATAAGARVLAAPVGDGTWQCLTAEDFIEAREEDRGRHIFRYKGYGMRRVQELSYREILFTPVQDGPSTSGFVHLHLHTEASALDGMSKVSEVVQAAVDDNQIAVAVTDHGICASHPHLQKEANKAGIKPIFGCLLKGQAIVTSSGMKPIEQIDVGDFVLTHQGRFRPVVRTMRRWYEGWIYEVYSNKGGRSVCLTEEHPILVRSRDGTCAWRKPGEIEAGYATKELGARNWKSYVCLPRLEEGSLQKVDWGEVLPSDFRVEAGEVVRCYASKYRADHRWGLENQVLDEELARWLGLFVAEGSVRHRRGVLTGTVVFSFGIHEKSYVEFVCRVLAKRFGLCADVRPRPSKSLCEVIFTCVPLAFWLKDWCGAGACNKKVPDAIYVSPRKVRAAFVDGLVEGDGKVGEHKDLKISSIQLAWGFRTLLVDLGHWRSVSLPIAATCDTKGRSRSDGKQFLSWTVGYDPYRAWAMTLEDDRFLYRPISRVDRSWQTVEVFNIEVEEDNSYVSEFVLHNCEAYFVDDRFLRPPPQPKEPSEKEQWKALSDSIRYHHHLILWAMNDEGLRNLWAMSTEANRTGFYYHPRMDWDILERYNEGVMCSTACLRGPLAKYLLEDQDDVARQRLGRLMEIFLDRLYVELQTNQLPEQMMLNARLAELAHDFSLPTIAAVDSHYPCADYKDAHRVWMAVQTQKDLVEDQELFVGDQDYHVMSEKEVRANLAYLGKGLVDGAVANTLHVANRCNAKIHGKSSPPVFSKRGGSQRDAERLVDICMANWDRKVKGKPRPESVYAERLEQELDLLIEKKFCGYFNIVADYCQWSKRNGILVGPSRGSGGGSLVAYLCDITEIDPVDSDLLFARFMTKGRKELPDFDVDFPASKREDITNYVIERYGEDHVVRVGTHVKVKNKGIIRSLAATLKNTIDINYPDINAICQAIDMAEIDTAGKGLSWEDLWDRIGDDTVDRSGNVVTRGLRFYADKYPLLFEMAEKMVGRLKSYGKHAAGVVISTAEEPLTGRLPLRAVGDDKSELVAEFDMEALESLGLVKFDLLTLDTLDTIALCIEKVKERRGIDINIYEWRDEYLDSKVWDQISVGHTLGIFQIETRGATGYTKRFKPRSLSDLADVVTIIRPGPKDSGLTEQYFRRRAGQEEVSVPDPRLEPVLRKTLGTILYQEDIMATCQILAGYDDEQADTVRKILGKKQVEKVEEEGRKFIPRCIERGMEEGKVRYLWEQMAEYSRYAFNRAHAFGYAVLGYWTAYLKTHHPVEFFASVLTTADKVRLPEFILEARRMGIKVLPPDINQSGQGFAIADDTTVRYGFDSVKEIGQAALNGILVGQPYKSFDDFMARKGKGCHSNHVMILARVGAFDSLGENRNRLEWLLSLEESGEAARCVFYDESVQDLPCRFDWDSEPIPIGKSGRPLKRKPPPKRCTVACRHYTKPDFSGVAVDQLSAVEVREREMELLGVHLSSTPFDCLAPDDLRICADYEELEAAPVDLSREILTVGTVQAVRSRYDRNGNQYAYVSLFAQTGSIDCVVFNKLWDRYHRDLCEGALVFASLTKNNRGFRLEALMPAGG